VLVVPALLSSLSTPLSLWHFAPNAFGDVPIESTSKGRPDKQRGKPFNYKSVRAMID
jgi:hypothetical protein